jgi:superfamily II DNA/RNA helicase
LEEEEVVVENEEQLLMAQDEDDDFEDNEEDEEEYGVRGGGSRRKIKARAKAALVGRSGRGAKKGQAPITIVKRSSSSNQLKAVQRGRSASGRPIKKTREDNEDEEFAEEVDGANEGDEEPDYEEGDEEEEDDEPATSRGAAIPGEDTVFIDNLPNDEFEIRRLLKEVRRNIK